MSSGEHTHPEAYAGHSTSGGLEKASTPYGVEKWLGETGDSIKNRAAHDLASAMNSIDALAGLP